MNKIIIKMSCLLIVFSLLILSSCIKNEEKEPEEDEAQKESSVDVSPDISDIDILDKDLDMSELDDIDKDLEDIANGW